MGRPPILKRGAMTAAERQRRRRRRLKKEQRERVGKATAARHRDEQAEKYIPYPPGITYWEKVRVQTAEGEREIFPPTTKPLAACRRDLDDNDIAALLDGLHKEMDRRRGV